MDFFDRFSNFQNFDFSIFANFGQINEKKTVEIAECWPPKIWSKNGHKSAKNDQNLNFLTFSVNLSQLEDFEKNGFSRSIFDFSKF